MRGRTRYSKKKMKFAKPKSEDSDSDDDEGIQKVSNNHIYFWCDVTKKSSLELIMNLNKVFNNYSSLSENGDNFTPIYLHINSYGGDTDAALAVIDTMDSLMNKGAHIITIVEGNASSAATFISVMGSVRRMRPNAYMRIHNFSTILAGKKNELDDEHGNLSKLEKVIIDFYKKNTKMNKRQLDKIMAREIDLLPSECLEKGLVDEIQQ